MWAWSKSLVLIKWNPLDTGWNMTCWKWHYTMVSVNINLMWPWQLYSLSAPKKFNTTDEKIKVKLEWISETSISMHEKHRRRHCKQQMKELRDEKWRINLPAISGGEEKRALVLISYNNSRQMTTAGVLVLITDFLERQWPSIPDLINPWHDVLLQIRK